MDQTVRFQEILRRLAMIDEGFVEGEAGLGLSPPGPGHPGPGLPGPAALDPKTAALLRVGVSVAIATTWPRPWRSRNDTES
jgi:hypothetical protein